MERLLFNTARIELLSLKTQFMENKILFICTREPKTVLNGFSFAKTTSDGINMKARINSRQRDLPLKLFSRNFLNTVLGDFVERDLLNNKSAMIICYYTCIRQLQRYYYRINDKKNIILRAV